MKSAMLRQAHSVFLQLSCSLRVDYFHVYWRELVICHCTADLVPINLREHWMLLKIVMSWSSAKPWRWASSKRSDACRVAVARSLLSPRAAPKFGGARCTKACAVDREGQGAVPRRARFSNVLLCSSCGTMVAVCR